MQKNRKSKITAKSITITALMIAISVAIGIVCKTTLNFGGGLFRITFENLPIILSGILYGPIVGGVVGLSSDILSYLLSGQAYPLNILVTVGATAIGVISGVVSRYIVKKKGNFQIILSGALAHLIGSMIIKPIGLYQFYGILTLWRIPLYLVIASLEIALLCILLKRKSFANVVGYKDKEQMNYKETIDYIHSVSWTFCKPGLERIEELCEKIDNPQSELRFIHVAGTNGKGSFCSMLSSVLIAQGYTVGTFTSPYVKVFNERMCVNGEMISDEELSELTAEIKPIADSMEDKPTEFELITAIGFQYFKRKKCDYVVLECGLGGRLDSTNIVENSILSVITGIAFDHTSILGNTIKEIAMEKAGIIKEGIPVLWCGDSVEAREVIFAEAERKNAPFYDVEREYLTVKKQTLDGTIFDYDDLNNIKISLLGTYQIENATNVLNAIKVLKGNGVEISNEAIYQGLAKAKWHARFEVILDTPMVIFDGGHNPQGVVSAVNSIKQYLGDERVYAITGVMADKDYSFIASEISKVSERVFCLTPDNSRALDSEAYAEVYRGLGIEAESFKSIDNAIFSAVEMAMKNDKKILCLGSLYMYADVLKAIESLEKR